MSSQLPARDRSRDPRDRVTPDAFSVAPELLGLPLAEHPRRVGAILGDLLLVGLVSQVGWVVLGIAAGLLFFRLAIRRSDARTAGVVSGAMRGSVGCLGALILFVTVMATWGGLELGIRGSNGAPGLGARGLEDFAQGFQEVQRFRAAGDAVEAEARAGELAPRLRTLGVTQESEIRDFLREVAPPDASWVSEMEEWELPGAIVADTTAAAPADTTDAKAADTSAAEAADRSAAEAADELRAERAAAAAARDDPGPRAWLRRVAEDLGLGFGWGALYFTLFTTLWKGRTPGKRLLGLRVVRLDGMPINWWAALERYGGYTAGFATGLLGFLQVLWDPNRQATHDKIAGTVVIRDRPRHSSASS